MGSCHLYERGRQAGSVPRKLPSPLPAPSLFPSPLPAPGLLPSRLPWEKLGAPSSHAFAGVNRQRAVSEGEANGEGGPGAALGALPTDWQAGRHCLESPAECHRWPM